MSSDRNPMRSIERQLERMQRQVEDVLTRWDVDPMESGIGLSSPSVDLADRGDRFELTADVPGFERSDIDLQLVDDTVRLTAERDEETEEGDERYLTRERRRRSLNRSITLPEPVEEEATEATYRNGVVTVTLPKRDRGDDGESIELE